MSDIRSAATRPEQSPTEPVITNYDEQGRVVQTISPATRTSTTVFYGSNGAKQSFEKKDLFDHMSPPTGTNSL